MSCKKGKPAKVLRCYRRTQASLRPQSMSLAALAGLTAGESCYAYGRWSPPTSERRNVNIFEEQCCGSR